jgi:hypothetical protein
MSCRDIVGWQELKQHKGIQAAVDVMTALIPGDTSAWPSLV